MTMPRFLRQICFYSRSLPPLFNRPPPVGHPPSALMQVQVCSRLHNRFPPHCSPLMLDHSPFLDCPSESFPPESPVFDSEQLIFGPLDVDDGRRHDPSLSFPWDATGALPTSPVPTHSVTASPASSASLLDFATSPPSSDFSFTPSSFPGLADLNPALVDLDDRNLYSNWLVDDLSAASSTSVPIIVSSTPSDAQPSTQAVLTQYIGDNGSLAFPKMGSFSPPLEYIAPRPLPRSVEETPMASISPPQITQPSWAAQLWSHPDLAGASASPVPHLLHPPDESDNFATQRPQRGRNNSLHAHTIFQSSSAPPGLQIHTPPLTRAYSRRAESVSMDGDHDATVRRKRKSSDVELSASGDPPRQTEVVPQKSLLRPPKLAPSAWQLYFTDWIQRHQASSTRKLNVAQAAKEAGVEYARLSAEEKEPYKRRSLAMKEIREREHHAYMSSLTPEDIKRENMFRAAQRKAGKSRRGNIKDPNAPKKPLSAYFMFLQRIRSDPVLVNGVFGDETETTKQSVLAAEKWRSMTDEERKPFLAQAEQEKLEYESARKLYEEGTTGYGGTSISFSVLPESPFHSTAAVPIRPLRPIKRGTVVVGSGTEGDAFYD
ncbi:hypothetical protein F5148DRAFT_1157379 [Russula earlei]|uniref:Uncharacterized protein n=1 Tax=Russula earlei TaxID=71964 RepID=A0ACC0UQA6_9AGAM|nr:hypothetical protein F5148DRAFT_1157379 [Russula earlei]